MRKLDLKKFEKELREFLQNKLGEGNWDFNWDKPTDDDMADGFAFYGSLSVWDCDVIDYDYEVDEETKSDPPGSNLRMF